MCRLIDDIQTRFPPGQLPPVDKMTMRDPDEIEALLKGPMNSGKHLYTVAYPP
jgi:creatinine amidohydrolase